MKTVYLNDAHIDDINQAEHYFKLAADWATEQCKSFVNYDVQDVSDVSYTYDTVAVYLFNDSKDAVWFELKWKK